VNIKVLEGEAKIHFAQIFFAFQLLFYRAWEIMPGIQFAELRRPGSRCLLDRATLLHTHFFGLASDLLTAHVYPRACYYLFMRNRAPVTQNS